MQLLPIFAVQGGVGWPGVAWGGCVGWWWGNVGWRDVVWCMVWGGVVRCVVRCGL